MNFSRKRPRDGRDDAPPAKRPDLKGQDKPPAAPSKLPTPAPSKTTAAPPATAKTTAPKPLPPAPPRPLPLSEEQVKLNVEDVRMEVDPVRLLDLIDEVREVATNMADRAILLGAEEAKADEQLKELMQKGFIALARLRTVHRQVHREVEQRKQQTSKHGEADLHEAIQRLQSTEHGLETFKEIVQYYPALQEAVGVISEAEFSAILGLENPSDVQLHQQIIARLKYEEEQRRALAAKLREIPIKQTALKSSLNTETRELDALKQKIRDFGSELKQLKSTLKIPDPTLQQTDSRACKLPQPLYNLYVQLISYISLFAGSQMDVTISGSEAMAARLSSKKHTDGDKASSGIATSQYGSYKPKTKLSAEEAQQTHPFSILLNIAVFSSVSSSSPGKIGFLFEYLLNLNIVTVTPTSNEDPRILAGLYPGDFGETSPNWATELIVAPGTQILPKRARAYKWLQALCGLHFQPGPQVTNPNKPAEPSFIPDTAPFAASLTDTIELIKQRTSMRHTVAHMNASLTTGRIEMECARALVVSAVALRKWAELTTVQASAALSDAQTLSKERHLTFSTPIPTASPYSFYYLATFGSSGSPSTAQLLVELPPQYPQTPASCWITNIIKDASDSDVTLLTESLQQLKHEESDLPVQAPLLSTLAWFRECLNIILDTIKSGANSKYSNHPKRFDRTAWQSIQ